MIARHGEDGVVEMVLQAASSSVPPSPQPSRARKVLRVLGWSCLLLVFLIINPQAFAAWLLLWFGLAIVSWLWDRICNWFREITTVRY